MQALADRFLKWAGPTDVGPSRYDLYWHFLSQLSHPEAFWTELAIKADTLDGHRRREFHYLFMGAVQYLVLGDSREPLAGYFPSSSAFDPNLTRAQVGEVFEEFYLRRHAEIWRIVQTRDVQINKLGRLGLFAPLFAEVARRSTQPLAFVDVGCSVGFGLLWPHFSYHYPDHGQIETEGKFGEISCFIEGTPSIPLNGKLPNAVFLCGIEVAPLSPQQKEDVRWLFALTAPDDGDGRAQLRKGIEAVAMVKPRIETGCVLDVLPRLVNECGNDKTLVIYHSMTMHHLREASKEEAFYRILPQIAETRRVFEIGVEWVKNILPAHKGPKPVEVTLSEWQQNHSKCEFIAETDPSADGRFLRFL